MTLGQVAGLFYVLLGGLALALAVALLEFCQYGRAEAARANVPLRAALTAKAGLGSRAERKTPPQRTPQRETDRLPWNGGAFTGVSFFILLKVISLTVTSTGLSRREFKIIKRHSFNIRRL